MQPRLKHFGWGRESEGLTPTEEAFVLGRVEQMFGPLAEGKVKPPRLEDIELTPPRLDPPPSLPFCSTALYDRAATANHSPIMSAGWSATTATDRTWLPIRVLRRRSRRCSTGRAALRRA